ncbi:flagellar basal body rod protein FlgC [Candidatus Kuenenia sp.]|uniref:flagellar basal body rod protein FlgC n=1 Tax=Candidatus Kuenenia sp. TaxID=2499824 RepID=UPI00321FA6F7
MGISKVFSALDISATGLTAERIRMNVIANNIANANATNSPDGGPYRREQVEFQSILNKAANLSDIDGMERLGGVKVSNIMKSNEPFNKVFIPGHPQADENGFVEMPNVNIATEMVDLVTASRSYEANLAVINSSKDITNQALSIIGR